MLIPKEFRRSGNAELAQPRGEEPRRDTPWKARESRITRKPGATLMPADAIPRLTSSPRRLNPHLELLWVPGKVPQIARPEDLNASLVPTGKEKVLPVGTQYICELLTGIRSERFHGITQWGNNNGFREAASLRAGQIGFVGRRRHELLHALPIVRESLFRWHLFLPRNAEELKSGFVQFPRERERGSRC